MIPQKPITQWSEITKRCLDNYWHGMQTPYGYSRGWDIGSPAYHFTKRWAINNFKRLKKMTWIQIYKEYRLAMRQD